MKLCATAIFAIVMVAATNLSLSVGAVNAGPLKVVTTISQIADAARAISGDRAEVSSLMGEGVDPHTYQLTRTDVRRLSQANIIFWNGLFLEAQLEDFLTDLGATKPVVALGPTLDEDQLLAPAEFAGNFDPHIWMDPKLWSDVVTALADELIKIDPEGKDAYLANSADYLQKIAELDAYNEAALATVPLERRVMISAHDAFNYFGRRYGFEVIGIQGLSTASEAGLLAVENLVEMIVTRKISAVFAESSVSARNVRALIEGAKAQGHSVTVGGQLFSDAMGRPGTYEGSYIGMLDHNVTTITRALDGEAPALGFGGKLSTGG